MIYVNTGFGLVKYWLRIAVKVLKTIGDLNIVN